MKIAMIGHKRVPSREGGVEIVVEELSTRLVKNGHQVDIYNRKGKNVQDKNVDKDKKGLKEYKGIKLITIPTINKKGIDALLYSFFATIKALFGKYDVIHYHAEGPCAMLWIPHLFGIKTVATIHGLDWQRSKWGGFATKYIKFGEKIAAKYADEIIVLSKGVQKYFKDTYNRETNFIPNGVNKPEIKEANLIKEKWGLEKDSYILFLARIVPEKGLHYLIEAYKQIHTDKKLVIAGGASHTNDYLEQIKEKVKDDNRIIMTGFVQGEEWEELYSNCYLYCLPSDVEGMPISLLEAMSYGCNCLVSDIEENIQVTEEFATTFKKGNVKDLKNKLEDILNLKVKVEKENISNNVLKKYNWNDNVESLQYVYKEKLKEEKNDNRNSNNIEKKIYTMYAYYFLLLPILIILDGYIKFVGTILTGVPIVFGMLIILLYKRKKIFKYIGLITILMIGIINSKNISLQLELVKPLIIFFTIFDLIENEKFLENLKEIFIRYIKLFNILIIIIIIINLFLYIGKCNIGFSEIDTKTWGTLAFKGTFTDPHQAAYRFCTLIVCSMLFMKNSTKKLATINYIEIILLEFLLLMTGARTPTLLGIVLGIIATYFIIKREWLFIKNNKKIFIPAIIIITIAIIVIIPNTAFFKKMIVSLNGNFDSGRSLLRNAEWNFFINSDLNNKFFGNSAETILNVNKEGLGGATWCHNDIMQILLQFGIIILAMYLFTYVRGLVYQLKNTNKKIEKAILILLYIVFVFVAFFNGFFFHPRFVVSIPIIVSSYKEDKKDEKNNE